MSKTNKYTFIKSNILLLFINNMYNIIKIFNKYDYKYNHI